MTPLVQSLQALSGILWLVPAVYLLPRLARAWRPDATRTEMLSAPIGFIAWLMVGFSVRWLAWPGAIVHMSKPEQITWAALYALSGGLAMWVFVGARQTRGQ